MNVNLSVIFLDLGRFARREQSSSTAIEPNKYAKFASSVVQKKFDRDIQPRINNTAIKNQPLFTCIDWRNRIYKIRVSQELPIPKGTESAFLKPRLKVTKVSSIAIKVDSLRVTFSSIVVKN